MNIGHLNKSIISYRNVIDGGLILVPKYSLQTKNKEEFTMLKILDLEEKKLIIAYFIAKGEKNIGIEYIWREWHTRWNDDFSVNGWALRRYNHQFVKSKTKAREMARKGEADIYKYKEYDDLLAQICEWMEANYDNTISRQENAGILRRKLLEYKGTCGRELYSLLKRSGLKEKGYRLQNAVSVKNVQDLGKYSISYKDGKGFSEYVQGTYEQIVNWINNKIEVKNEDE